jgi:hypothetical protein
MAAKYRIPLFISGNIKGILKWSQYSCNILWSKKLQQTALFACWVLFQCKGRVTDPIFTEFWMSKLEGQLQEYYTKGTLYFKILIIANNVHGHPTTWDLYEYTKDFYLSHYYISNAKYVLVSESNI